MPLLIADTGPLLAFAWLDRLELLMRLYGPVFIPPAVERELDLDGGRPDFQALKSALNAGGLTVRVPEESSVARIDDPTLHEGERQALALALDVADCLLLMDERRGRIVAQGLDLPVVGTLGALLKAKRGGLIPLLRPLVEILAANGYRLSPTLVAHALELAGET